MRSYTWWRKQKRRVQKKYTLFLGAYLTPREAKLWYKAYKQGRIVPVKTLRRKRKAK